MWKDLLTFNRAERRGTWLLSLLACLAWGLNLWFPFSLRGPLLVDEAEQQRMFAIVQELNTAGGKTIHSQGRPKDTSAFYPYSSRHTTAPKPSGDLRSRNVRGRPNTGKAAALPLEAFDLNLADSAALEHLPGIGPVLAARILSYREALGGYFAVEQLREVYGLKEEVFLRIQPCLFVSGGPYRRLDIHSDAFRDLLRHPYLDYEMVKDLFKARRDSNTAPHAILGSMPWPDSLKLRLEPYLPPAK